MTLISMFVYFIFSHLGSHVAQLLISCEGPSHSENLKPHSGRVDGVWKGVYLQVVGHSKQLSVNKVATEEKRGKKKKTGKKREKRRMTIVATTSLPAVDRPNADRWNAARSRQLLVLFQHHIREKRITS